MKPLELGAATRYRAIPSRSDTAAAFGNTGVGVVATQALIIYLEHACHSLMASNYGPGEGSVGSRVCVDHLAPAFPDVPVDVEATLKHIDGRQLEFEVTLKQAERVVMHGTHTRVLLDLARFRAKAAQRAAVAPQRTTAECLAFWFDFNSPWCYLACLRIGPLARLRGLEVDWRPVHLAKLNARIDGRRPLEENDAFVDWYRQDLADYAALQGVAVHYHPRFPLRPSRALRASLYASDKGLAEPFVQAVMGAYWGENQDIENPSMLAAIGESVGLDPVQIDIACASKDYRARLDASLDEAVAAGIFGLPTTVYKGKRYFGNDRLELLERHLDAR